MQSSPLFNETQRFRRWWLLFSVIVFLIIAVVLIPIFFYDAEFDQNRQRSLLVGGISCVVLVVFMLITRLETAITQTGIQYQFFPFHWKKHQLTWEEIEDIKVITYSPLKDYGGWGYRLKRNGDKALNVSGNQGIECKLKSGKIILFGTKDPQAADAAINQIFKGRDSQSN